MEDRATHPVLTLPIPHLQDLQRGTTGAKPPCFGVGDKDSLIGERKRPMRPEDPCHKGTSVEADSMVLDTAAEPIYHRHRVFQLLQPRVEIEGGSRQAAASTMREEVVPALFQSSLLRTAHNTNTVGLHTPCSSPRKEENAEAWVDMAEGELTGQTGQTKDSRGAKHTDLPMDTQGRALVQHCMLTTIACTPIVSGEEGRGEEKGERSTGRRLSPEADLPPLDSQAMGQWEAESAFEHSGHGKPAGGIATHKAGGRRLSPDGPPPQGRSMAWDEGSDWEVHTIFSSSTTTTTEDGCSGHGGERRRRGRRLCPESGSEPEGWRCWEAEASFNSTHNTNNHTQAPHYSTPRNNPSGPSCTSPVGGETDGECSSGFSSPSRTTFASPSPAPAPSLSHEDEDDDELCDWAEAMGTQVRQAQQDGGLNLCLSPSPSSSSSSSSLGPASSQGLVYLVAFRSPRPVSPPSWHPCFRPVVAVGRVAQRAYPMQALQRWLHYTFYCRLFKLWHTQQPPLVQPPPDPPGTFTLGMGRRRTGGESRGRGCVVEGHGGVRDVLSAFTSHGKRDVLAAYDHYRFLNMERDDAKTDKGLPLTLTRYPRVFTEHDDPCVPAPRPWSIRDLTPPSACASAHLVLAWPVDVIHRTPFTHLQQIFLHRIRASVPPARPPRRARKPPGAHTLEAWAAIEAAGVCVARLRQTLADAKAALVAKLYTADTPPHLDLTSPAPLPAGLSRECSPLPEPHTSLAHDFAAPECTYPEEEDEDPAQRDLPSYKKTPPMGATCAKGPSGVRWELCGNQWIGVRRTTA